MTDIAQEANDVAANAEVVFPTVEETLSLPDDPEIGAGTTLTTQVPRFLELLETATLRELKKVMAASALYPHGIDYPTFSSDQKLEKELFELDQNIWNAKLVLLHIGLEKQKAAMELKTKDLNKENENGEE